MTKCQQFMSPWWKGKSITSRIKDIFGHKAAQMPNKTGISGLATIGRCKTHLAFGGNL